MDSALQKSDTLPELPADLSPLAWVQEELRRSLEAVHKTLRRLVRDGETSRVSMAAFGSDAQASGPLQQAVAQLHQVAGVLALVGLPAGATVLRAAETAVARLVEHPLDIDVATVEVIERADFALLAYVARLLAGNKTSTLALYPSYRDLQQHNRAERVHPADLWDFEWSWREIELEQGVAPRSPESVRSPFEAALLRQMRQPHPSHAGNLSLLCAGLAAGLHRSHARTLWQLAAAVFEGQALQLLPVDAYIKRLGSRLLHELRGLSPSDSSHADTATDRLGQDLLFFCSQCRVGSVNAPRLRAVHEAFGLPVGGAHDYDDASLGRIDPAWVIQARRRVVAAKESWSSAAEGDQHRLSALDEQFAALGDSLNRLFSSGEVLAQTLQRAVVATLRSGRAPAPALAMEIATSLLYVEAALDDAAFDQPEQAERVLRLARRVEAVAHGQPAQPLEDWMEDLYRRVSDRQTLGSVVHELRASLSEVERQVDEYFRDPAKRDLLIPVPGQISAMRGVLSVLGLDQAAHACLRMRDEVDGLASTEIDFHRAGAVGVFERLATNLGALGFMIDMLSVQPQLAKRMFHFDEASGRLDPVMGRHEGAVALPDFEASGFDLTMGEVPALAAASPHDTQPIRRDLAELDLPDLNLPDLLLPDTEAATPAAAPVALPDVAEMADDPEMREIFLEEAQEVTERARGALAQLTQQPGDGEQLTVVRRAFHTLKGSARMVGMNDFGEGAWACEQLFNARLGEGQPDADAHLLAFTQQALDYLDGWREQIAASAGGSYQSAPLRRSADALRLHGQWLPLDAGDADVGAIDLPLDPAPEVEPSVEAAAFADTQSLHDEPLPSELPALPLVPDFVLDMDDPEPLLAQAMAEPTAGTPPLSAQEHADTELATQLLPELAAQQADIGLHDLTPIHLELDPEAPAELGERLPELGADEQDASLVEAGIEGVEVIDAGELVLDLPLESGEPAEAAEPVESALLATPTLTLVAGGLPDPIASVDAGETDAAPERAEAEDTEDADEGIKVIGPLRISIALFNIFLNEADELSRRLSTSLAEWAVELTDPVPASTEALAHALAGNAATVGYEDLSALARELEHALERAQRASGYALGDVQLFVRAADDIRHLLHQFAAGFLKPADAGIVARLHAYQPEQEDLEDQHAQTRAASLQDTVAGDLRLDFDAEPDTTAAPLVTQPAELDMPLRDQVTEAKAEPAVESLPASPSSPAIEPVSTVLEDDVPAGLPDNIEVDLYPIFEEEGRDLLQQLHAGLREWVAQPQDGGRADACMRALHTFKGGARLAGAMRLGEQAHHLESDIESVLRSGERSADAVMRLQDAGDALEHSFEELGRSLSAPATPSPAAVAAVVAAAEIAPPATVPVVPVPPTPPAAAQPIVLPAPAVAAPSGRPAESEPRREIDWSRWSADDTEVGPVGEGLAISQAQVRVRGSLLERMATQAGEVSIRRARLESELGQMKGGLVDLDDNLDRIRAQLRELELQAEAQMHTQQELAQQGGREFDPLEFDRYTRFQELTRMLTESVGDVATLQRTLSRNVQTGEDELAAQSRLTRELQDDLLRTRLVDFESVGERMHRVVRQAARDSGKQVKLEITGGQTELDRSVLERMAGAFEHLLRNSVSHGIESPEARVAKGKEASGTLRIAVSQLGNEVLLNFSDDGAGLNLERIRQRGVELGLIAADAQSDEDQLKRLIFAPGFSTASQITELSGRGVGMDVVRAEVSTLGGTIETSSVAGTGTSFLLRLPLTTALTQIVLLRSGDQVVAVPAALMDSVQRVPVHAVELAYGSSQLAFGSESLQFYWLGGLLGQSGRGHFHGKHASVVLVRSGQSRIALHVDEVVGNQEVVVKNLGAQLNRVPGLAGISLLASGDVALIYNVVALADWYGAGARARLAAAQSPQVDTPQAASTALAPLVLVVDDSLTVRRVTQRLLERVGYRVALAKDGLDAMEQLAGDELPSVVLSDIEMPRMDGFDLVRNMRADSRLAQLPVIMITSRIAQKHRDYAAQLGVEHYLGKPYDEEQLLALIAQFLGGSMAAQA